MAIDERLKEKRGEILRLCAGHGARNVRLFRSVARGQADAQSDIDFLVEMEPGRSLFDLKGLQYKLERLLGCPVDVVTERGSRRASAIGCFGRRCRCETPQGTTARHAGGHRGHRAPSPPRQGRLRAGRVVAAPVLLETERWVTDAGLARISSGLLPVGTVLLSSRAPIGYLAVAEVPVAINQGFIAMKPRKGVSNLFLLLWAHSAHENILSQANGSTFLEISKASFRHVRTVAPSPAALRAFDHLVRPWYQRIVSNQRESRTLSALRDALLPKLISGQLRVKDAERFLKERGL